MAPVLVPPMQSKKSHSRKSSPRPSARSQERLQPDQDGQGDQPADPAAVEREHPMGAPGGRPGTVAVAQRSPCGPARVLARLTHGAFCLRPGVAGAVIVAPPARRRPVLSPRAHRTSPKSGTRRILPDAVLDTPEAAPQDWSCVRPRGRARHVHHTLGDTTRSGGCGLPSYDWKGVRRMTPTRRSWKGGGDPAAVRRSRVRVLHDASGHTPRVERAPPASTGAPIQRT